MLTEFQEKWLVALESGTYPQGVGRLKSAKGYCCLGVACEVSGIVPVEGIGGYGFYEGHSIGLPYRVMSELHLRSRDGYINETTMRLSAMNDNGTPHKDIATFIRANPEKVFTNV